MIRIVSIFLVLSMGLMILAGCWRYTEVEEKLEVAGRAIDYDEQNKSYVSTFEVVNPQGFKKGAAKKIFTSRGKTLLDGIRNTMMESGNRLYTGHSQVFIVSKEIAQRGIIPVLDIIYRDAVSRTEMWLCISGGETAGEILKAGGDKIHTLNSFNIDELMSLKGRISQYRSVEIWRFLKDLNAEGISPTLPIISTVVSGDNTIIDAYGVAVFNKDKMVGTLDKEESGHLLWVINELKGGRIIIKPEIQGEAIEIVLEIIGNKTKLEPIYKDGKLVMKVNIKETSVNIAGVNGTTNVLNEKGLDIITQEGEDYIKKSIAETIKKVQKKYKSDIFGFGRAIRNEYPNEWRRIRKDWNEGFAQLPIEVDVRLNVIGSSLSNSTIKIRE